MPAPTTEERLAEQKLVDAEAKRRIRAALDRIERAQFELDRASQDLSAITFIAPEWKAVLAQRERVHALWYRVRRTLDRDRATLDSGARERFLASLGGGSPVASEGR